MATSTASKTTTSASSPVQLPDDVITYIDGRNDPDTLKDTDAIKAVEAKLDSDEFSPSDALALRLRLRLLNTIDWESRDARFVSGMASWLKSHDLTVDAISEDLTAASVPTDVIASLQDSVNGNGSAPSSSTVTSQDDVRHHVLSLSVGTRFSKADLEEQTGASAGTVHKAVKTLLDSEHIIEDGKIGRAKAYKLATTTTS